MSFGSSRSGDCATALVVIVTHAPASPTSSATASVGYTVDNNTASLTRTLDGAPEQLLVTDRVVGARGRWRWICDWGGSRSL